jgi:uncharacterized membrane protein affecting hemolysin expression
MLHEILNQTQRDSRVIQAGVVSSMAIVVSGSGVMVELSDMLSDAATAASATAEFVR